MVTNYVKMTSNLRGCEGDGWNWIGFMWKRCLTGHQSQKYYVKKSLKSLLRTQQIEWLLRNTSFLQESYNQWRPTVFEDFSRKIAWNEVLTVSGRTVGKKNMYSSELLNGLQLRLVAEKNTCKWGPIANRWNQPIVGENVKKDSWNQRIRLLAEEFWAKNGYWKRFAKSKNQVSKKFRESTNCCCFFLIPKFREFKAKYLFALRLCCPSRWRVWQSKFCDAKVQEGHFYQNQ